MSESKFKPQEHLTDMKGKQYLEVKWRLVWFKDENPKGAVTTEVMNTSPALVKAFITIDGILIATGHGSATAKGNAVWSGREIEKAETAAIGRALAHAGYGTQFTDDDESALADSPIEKKVEKPTTDPRADVVKKYNDLSDRAAKLGLTNIVILTPEMSVDDIKANGHTLKLRVQEKEKAGK